MADETKKNDLGLAESLANTALFDKKERHAGDAPADGPLFQDIDGDQSVTEIESLCMNCHENVRTTPPGGSHVLLNPFSRLQAKDTL
jgi:zinc finger protein